jgi:uncharacterized membrane protein
MPSLGPVELFILIANGAFLALFVAGLILVIRVAAGRSHGSETDDRDPAMDALRTRFAAGGIDQVEFERLRSILQRR